MRVKSCGLVLVAQGCSCSTIPDARRERRSARRASRAGGASPLAGALRGKTQPVAQVEQGDLPRIVQTRNVVHGSEFESLARLPVAFDARMYAAAALSGEGAQEVRLAASARAQRKTKRSPPREPPAAPSAPRRFSQGKNYPASGRRRGEFEQELLHQSMPLRRAAGISIKIRGRKHVTYLQPPVLTSRSRSLTATQGWISTRGTLWSRRSSPSQRGRCAGMLAGIGGFGGAAEISEGLDRLDQSVPRVDIHPCVAVSDRLLAGQDWGCR